jgi:CheY-like chemotaxis protein
MEWAQIVVTVISAVLSFGAVIVIYRGIENSILSDKVDRERVNELRQDLDREREWRREQSATIESLQKEQERDRRDIAKHVVFLDQCDAMVKARDVVIEQLRRDAEAHRVFVAQLERKLKIASAHGRFLVANTLKALLVIDDDRMVSESINDFVQKAGYRIHLASTGAEGINIYREHHGDIGLIILDIRMPDMTGFEVRDELLKINPNAPIVISSGYAGEQIDESIRRLDKPYRIADLIALISEYLDK